MSVDQSIKHHTLLLPSECSLTSVSILLFGELIFASVTSGVGLGLSEGKSEPYVVDLSTDAEYRFEISRGHENRNAVKGMRGSRFGGELVGRRSEENAGKGWA